MVTTMRWLLLLSSGCFYSNTRPYEAFLEDLGAVPTDTPSPTGTPDTAPPTPTGDPPPAYDRCSELGGDGLQVTFINQTGVVVDLYYITADCEPLNTALMPLGARETRPTAIGEVWRVRDAFDTRAWVGEVRIDGATEVVFE